MNIQAPKQHAPLRLAVIEGRLRVGGVDIEQLARRVGQTPFYAYDRQLMSDTVAQLRAALPSGLRIHYSIKANPMPAVVQHLSPQVDGLDVASAGELRIALDAGHAAADICFTGPGKTDAELAMALAAGIVINIESEGELDRLAVLARRHGDTPRLMVRVNPDFELKSSGMKMGGGAKQFGIDAERVGAVIGRIHALGYVVHGLHVFSGSQNLSAAALMEAQTQSFQLLDRLCREADIAPSLVNIGGGFGIPYFPGEQRLELADIGQHLAQLLTQWRKDHPKTLVAMEFGRYLVGEAGVYVSRVIDKKQSRGQEFLVIDGGLHHHLAASGNFGQVLRKNYPLALATRIAAPAHAPVQVVGPLCTPLDLMGDRLELPHAEIGDLIAIFQSGAYGYSASPHHFLGHPAPLEVLV